MEERRLGIWEKYLTLWVALCIAAGTLLGRAFPQISDTLAKLEVAHISIPIAICLFAMIYPIMVQISFEEIKKASRNPRPIVLTLVANWLVKPFTIALLAWFFLQVVFGHFLSAEQVQEYRAGLILLSRIIEAGTRQRGAGCRTQQGQSRAADRGPLDRVVDRAVGRDRQVQILQILPAGDDDVGDPLRAVGERG